MTLMQWPSTTDKQGKAGLSKLSDGELDNLMIKSGLMQQDDLDQQHDSPLMIALANLPGGPPDYYETWRGLMQLRDAGPFPFEVQDLYDRLRERAVADVKAALRASAEVIPPTSSLPADTSMAGWLSARWESADAAVRNALQLLADSLGVSLPLRRTRHAAVQDSSSTGRTESTL